MKKSLGSVSGDASAEEDAILEELAMISSSASASDNQQKDAASTINDEEEEKRDAFVDMPSPLSLPASGAVHRPIPLLHTAVVANASQGVTKVGHHPRLQALQSSGQSSLPTTAQDQDSVVNGKQGMSRSISDSTLRRAALHLNLNQSVLPSFTSLQQFKVYSIYCRCYKQI